MVRFRVRKPRGIKAIAAGLALQSPPVQCLPQDVVPLEVEQIRRPTMDIFS